MNKPGKYTSIKKSFYRLNEVKRLVREDFFDLMPLARKTAGKCFSWETKDVKKAILLLRVEHFYKTEPKYDNPPNKKNGLQVDIYKARGIMGENVYLHFRIEDGRLIICSFKDIKRGECNEML